MKKLLFRFSIRLKKCNLWNESEFLFETKKDSRDEWKNKNRRKLIHLTNRGSTRKAQRHKVPRYREIFSTLASIQASSKPNSSSLVNSSSMLLYYSSSSSSSSASSSNPPPFALPFTSFQDWRISNGRTMPSEGGGKQSSSRPTFVLDLGKKSSFWDFPLKPRKKYDFSYYKSFVCCVRGKLVCNASGGGIAIGTTHFSWWKLILLRIRWCYWAASCRPILRGMSLRNNAWPQDGECYPVWAHARTPPPRNLGSRLSWKRQVSPGLDE